MKPICIHLKSFTRGKGLGVLLEHSYQRKILDLHLFPGFNFSLFFFPYSRTNIWSCASGFNYSHFFSHTREQTYGAVLLETKVVGNQETAVQEIFSSFKDF